MARKKPGERASKRSSLVRFTDAEYCFMKEDSTSTGRSIPELLRERYFKRRRPRPLLAKADAINLLTTMLQVGNGISHLNRMINSGIREGFVPELDDINESFDLIISFLVARRCRCKPIRKRLQTS